MIFRTNNTTYDVPKEAADAFIAVARQIPKKLTTDNGSAHVPATLRSISFATILAEWAQKNWSAYVVGGQH